MEPKRLYRSRTQRMLCGVCGGIAEYFNIDPTLIRLVWALVGLTGSGIIAYFVAAVIIPDEM
ncbi:MAG: PspC domain-containing protein [Ruminococcus sp.]|nr:PspC domain-containing protein [Ruminococcus sp.]